MAGSLRERVLLSIVAVVSALLAVALVEGLSSLVVSVDAMLEDPKGPRITGFDPELGWTVQPGVAVEEAWGAGTDVHTDDRGFRGREPLPSRLPAGRRRVVCSGDSFTFAQGVGDADAWCHRLGLFDSARDTANLGVMGYGVDQAYLRYSRDTAELEHTDHVFAFIGPDLTRAAYPVRDGFPKPTLQLSGDRLEVVGPPLPRVLPALRRRLAKLGGALRSVEVAGRVWRKLSGPGPGFTGDPVEGLEPVLERLFAEVEALGRERGARTLFVYLPVRAEIETDGPWHPFVREHFRDAGPAFLDLTGALRSLDPNAAAALFIPADEPAGDHYSPRGNAWVARHVDAGLSALENAGP